MLTLFCLSFNAAEFCILMFFRHYIIMIYTRKEVLIGIADSIIWAILIVQAGDFHQFILSGALQALGKMKTATIVNLVTYYVIACPLAYYFAFEHSYHYEPFM